MRFDELELEDSLLQGLDAMNFQETTPIQELTIPVILEGKDLIACAQTGTGKTAAYTLPILNRLIKEENRTDTVKAVIMAPTRELAQQIDVQFEGFSYFLPVSTVVVYGGGDGSLWDQQKKALRLGADVAIATPGRLIAHLQHSDVDLSQVKYFILDEADRMLDMGFFDDIMQIVNKLPKDRQTILFSATMPPKIRQLAQNVLRDQKMGIIEELFSKPVLHKTLIFASSKQKVKDLAFTLKRKKFNVAVMHSDLEQSERESVMMDFKNNKIDILVATDIVSRGIDIDEIGLVINFDVPHDPEDYIHRIGRTARASAEGVALTFVSGAEQGKFYRIEQFIEETIYKIPLPTHLGAAPEYNPKAFEHGSSKGRGRKPNGRSFVKKKNHVKREGGSN